MKGLDCFVGGGPFLSTDKRARVDNHASPFRLEGPINKSYPAC
jgi:hypothetical protein